MKKVWCVIFIIFVITLTACASSTGDELSEDELTDDKLEEVEKEKEQLIVKIKELEKQIDEQSQTIEEQKENIEALGLTQSVNNYEVKNESEEYNNTSISTLKLGETYSDDKYDITVTGIEYTSTLNKGPEVFFEVRNKSEEPLENAGSLTFRLNDAKYEEEFNNLGYTINFNPPGFIYQDEKRSGSYHYLFDRDVKITEITYHLSESGYPKDPIATWVIE